MCGIFAVSHPKKVEKFCLKKAIEHSSRQTHRGPDFTGHYQNADTGDILCHERLSIIDLTCAHPLKGTSEEHWVVHNGEIYNHALLRQTELSGMQLRTTCDSEVIIFMYERFRDGSFCNMLDGVFGLALISDGTFLAARDPIGVKQLYFGKDSLGRFFFASEMKCLEDLCGGTEINHFPPGHYFTQEGGFIRYYQPEWFDYRICTREADLREIRTMLIAAVRKRLMSDAPLGVLLSGGLDSSLISAIVVRELREVGAGDIHSFSIGVDHNSPDLKAARDVARFINTNHHEVTFSVEYGIKNLRNLIWHLETYDVTSIRASTPMFFLSEYIRKHNIKVVLSGEGADEIFGGYLYFHNAPSDEEFQKETIDRVLHLYTADCLRADKSTMAHSVEVRVPFLDKDFLNAAMTTRACDKRPQMYQGRMQEKFLLRQAFVVDDDEEMFIPDHILNRQKEQFSDGVGYNWIDELIEHCASQVTDEEMAKAALLFPYNTPKNKEAFFMRRTFAEMFPSEEAAKTVRMWIPKWQTNEDPSGRASNVHEQTTHKEPSVQSTDLLDKKMEQTFVISAVRVDRV